MSKAPSKAAMRAAQSINEHIGEGLACGDAVLAAIIDSETSIDSAKLTMFDELVKAADALDIAMQWKSIKVPAGEIDVPAAVTQLLDVLSRARKLKQP